MEITQLNIVDTPGHTDFGGELNDFTDGRRIFVIS